MKILFIIISATGVVLAVLSALFWTNVLGGNTPEGWKSYRSTELGFRIDYPEYMEIISSADPQQFGITFLFYGQAQDEGQLDIVDVIEFSVSNQQLSGQSLEEAARARSIDAQPITIGQVQGYRYQLQGEGEKDHLGPAPWIVLVSSNDNEFFEIMYLFKDPNNQGYQQIVEQMLASFETL